ncbi:MAG: type VI secretion system baseplate subunit TssG, partial [Planctomycetales bacterium]|nr:type VI secretion system baseplate subunit TssG [Planctomycetales bacterium]
SPSTLCDYVAGTGGRTPRLNVRFFGMFGPNGPLPLHLSEYTRERERNEKDPTLRRFMDVFHHRMIALFYRAWAEAQPTVQFERGVHDRFSTYVASMFGIGAAELRDRDEIPDVAKLHHAGHLAAQSRHPEGLQAILTSFFQLPVQIDEFVGQWTELPDGCRCYLGGMGQAVLGQSSTIGKHIWDCQQKFRIKIGPMGWDDYQRLLPSGGGLKRLVALVRNYIGEELMWDLNVVLRREETPGVHLGVAGQLGRSCWICPEALTADADDLVLSSQPPKRTVKITLGDASADLDAASANPMTEPPVECQLQDIVNAFQREVHDDATNPGINLLGTAGTL